MHKPEVFISYNSQEHHLAQTICTVLEQNGIACWIAPRDIPTGSNYASEIPKAIKTCTFFLLVLSAKSQSSPWVAKEISLALTYGKTVLPVVLEPCELTDSFAFYLTDIQRYNAYEKQTGVFQEIIEEICETRSGKLFCKQDGCVPNRRYPIIEWISNHPLQELNKIFAKLLTELRKKYRENPNASIIKDWFHAKLVDGILLSSILDTFFNLNLYSYNACEIYIQLAVIYIHAGEIRYVHEAQEYLTTAIQALSSSESYDATTFQRVVYAKWLIAITYKQERNYGCASDLCEELIHFIDDENEIFDLPYSQALLLPQRELVVLNKEKVMCDFLCTKLTDIEENPREFFCTQKRLFEFYVLKNDFQRASELIPSLLHTFSICENRLEAIYKVGLFQDFFEYYTYIGRQDLAQKYYHFAYTEAKRNFWVRKQEKLESLKQIYLDLPE